MKPIALSLCALFLCAACENKYAEDPSRHHLATPPPESQSPSPAAQTP